MPTDISFYKKWEILNKTHPDRLTTNNIVNILLKNRGVETSSDRKEFFHPTPPQTLTLKELGIKSEEVKKAIARLKTAKKTNEKIIVYGDYDADGICASAILWEALYHLGLNVLPYIPDRFSEGYGLNSETIKKLKKESPDLGLIITVDHGIVAAKKIKTAKKLGIDVIVTDHHLPSKLKPRSLATVHTTKIGGAAVAWVLAREVRASFGQKKKAGEGLDLAAIGTIADQLSLTGANRSFAKHGLAQLRKTKRPGLKALFREASISPEKIGVYEVGFMIAPRLNATGRLFHAIDSLRLLCVKDAVRAGQLAVYLSRTNLQRQKIVDEVVIHARGFIGKAKYQQVIVLAHESYHEGVIGLAASRLVEEFYRPAIVISTKGEIAKASARSIPGFNIIEAIRNLDDLLLEGGGHPMAAGFSIPSKKIKEFIRRINENSTKLLTGEIIQKRLKIDLELQFNQLNRSLLKAIESFEPTGYGNPKPTFVTKDLEIDKAGLIGKDSSHLKLNVGENGFSYEAVGWGFGQIYSKIKLKDKLDIVYNFEENVWNGARKFQLKLKDVRTTI